MSRGILLDVPGGRGAPWLEAGEPIYPEDLEQAERELVLLGKRSDEALESNNLSEARDLLRAALTINDEHVSTNVRWAELMTLMGRPEEASRAWRRVLQLDHSPQGRQRAAAALAASDTR